MENDVLIKDTGLFVGQEIFEFSMTESFESITSLFQTIQQYREFTNPEDAAAWFDYVHQIFHIFGFNTAKVAPRLITLLEMGTTQTPKALVCIIGPHENFDNIIFGFKWESYLFYAAKYHKIDWVILTNGLQFKVLNYSNDADQQKYFKCEFDEIVKNGKTDNFFTIYKIFSLLNLSKGKTQVAPVTNKEVKEKGTGQRKITDRHHLREEFWTQLLAKSQNKTILFKNKKPGIESYLSIGAGIRGLGLVYVINQDFSRIEIYMDNGNSGWNKNVFDFFFQNKSEIENKFGTSLIWDRLDNNRASLIRYDLKEGGLNDKEKWPDIQDKMIDSMIKFEEALRPYIEQVKS